MTWQHHNSRQTFHLGKGLSRRFMRWALGGEASGVAVDSSEESVGAPPQIMMIILMLRIIISPMRMLRRRNLASRISESSLVQHPPPLCKMLNSVKSTIMNKVQILTCTVIWKNPQKCFKTFQITEMSRKLINIIIKQQSWPVYFPALLFHLSECFYQLPWICEKNSFKFHLTIMSSKADDFVVNDHACHVGAPPYVVFHILPHPSAPPPPLLSGSSCTPCRLYFFCCLHFCFTWDFIGASHILLCGSHLGRVVFWASSHVLPSAPVHIFRWYDERDSSFPPVKCLSKIGLET